MWLSFLNSFRFQTLLIFIDVFAFLSFPHFQNFFIFKNLIFWIFPVLRHVVFWFSPSQAFFWFLDVLKNFYEFLCRSKTSKMPLLRCSYNHFWVKEKNIFQCLVIYSLSWISCVNDNKWWCFWKITKFYFSKIFKALFYWVTDIHLSNNIISKISPPYVLKVLTNIKNE